MYRFFHILNDSIKRVPAASCFKRVLYGFKRGGYRFLLPLRPERNTRVLHRQCGIRRNQSDNRINQYIETGARF